MGTRRALRALVLAAAAGVAATAGGATPAAGAQGPAGAAGPCHPEWPVIAHHAGAQAVTLPAGSALPVPCAGDTGYESSESTLAVTTTGAIFYSPAHTENSIAISQDQGATWKLSYPPDEQYTSLWNTDDPFVTADPRTGRVFWSHATGDLRTTPILVSNSPLPNGVPTAVAYAHGFQVYSTADDGRTWHTADYTHEFTGDWDKLAVGPPPPATTGAAQPKGYPDVVYMCANAPFEVSGPGSDCYKSLDGGVTFTLAGYVFPSPTQPADVCPALGANTPVVASDGTMYHPVNCERGDYLAVSRDEGATYTWLPVPGAPPASGVSGPLHLAIDQADNLYGLWVANDRLYLVISRDRGQSWSAPLMVLAPGLHNVNLPAFAAGPRGQVGIVYYASSDSSAQTLTAYVTQTLDALDPKPLFYTGALNAPAHPIFRAYGFNASPRADYVGGSYDSHGTFWAGVVRQLGVPDSNGNVATTGYVGRLQLAGVSPSAGTPGGAELASPAPAGVCETGRRLTFRIRRVPGGRVVRAAVYLNGRLARVRRGHNLRRVSVPRPAAPTLSVRIVTVNNRGGRVVTVRSFVGCSRTPVRGRVIRHRRAG